jgi:hypothetical protein
MTPIPSAPSLSWWLPKLVGLREADNLVELREAESIRRLRVRSVVWQTAILLFDAFEILPIRFRLHPIKPTSLRLPELFEQFRRHFVEFLAAFLLHGDELESD